jgi:hypothetical protein
MGKSGERGEERWRVDIEIGLMRDGGCANDRG